MVTYEQIEHLLEKQRQAFIEEIEELLGDTLYDYKKDIIKEIEEIIKTTEIEIKHSYK